MFANLFFLILILLLTSIAPESSTSSLFPVNSLFAFLGTMLAYIGTLALFYLQSRWFGSRSKNSKGTLIFLANIELAVFFMYAYFALGIQRVFLLEVLAPFGMTLFSLISLTLYFAGLTYAHYTSECLTLTKKGALNKAIKAVRFLVPFSLPFLFFITLGDAFELIPYAALMKSLGIAPNSFAENLLITLLLIAFMTIAIIFLPLLIIVIWQCKRLKDPVLEARLEALCQRANFKHAGFRIWTVMEGLFTAAIIGVVGKFRYVMFTQKLLDRLSPNAIEAILAHEIGHSRHKHLLLYPLILFGMIIAATLFTSLINEPLAHYLAQQNAENPSLIWKVLATLASFIPFIIMMALYFRFVFGYFSRLFERQADLHVFELKVPPEYLVESLDELATASGNIHLIPNWHHYSIQERIDYIKHVEKDPSLLPKHYRKIYISLAVYVIALGAAMAALITRVLIQS